MPWPALTGLLAEHKQLDDWPIMPGLTTGRCLSSPSPALSSRLLYACIMYYMAVITDQSKAAG